jgi:histidinol-phosphate aminotransferase
MSDDLRDLVPDPLRAIDAYTVPSPAGVDARAKLDANESPYPLPPEIAEALARELAAVDIHRYPDPACHELRGLIAPELGVAPEQLAFGHGSNELVIQLCLAFNRPRAGADRAVVLYPVPSFVYYRSAAIAAGAEPVEVPLGEDFRLDAPALAATIEHRRPNIIFFARPNNPTGTLWSRPIVDGIIRDNPGVIVVVDEAYIEFGGDSFADKLSEYRNMILLRTYSKVGMAGLRLGVLAAHLDLVGEIGKVNAPYNVSALTQRAAAFLLANHRDVLRARVAEITAERERVATALRGLAGVQVFDSSANMLLVRLGDAATAWRELAARGIRVRRFPTHPRLEPYIRVTIGTPAENTLFLEALEQILP